MKNPWYIVGGFVLVLIISVSIFFAPEWFRLATDRFYFDKPVHFFSGYLIAAAGVYCFGIRRFSAAVFLPLIFGGGWEIFEHLINPVITHTFGQALALGALDTATDLLADVVGGIFYWFIHLRGK